LRPGLVHIEDVDRAVIAVGVGRGRKFRGCGEAMV
jgi:hypothetical protein